MLNVCFNSRDRVLISMLYEGGFRVKELGTLPGNRSRSTITA